MQHIRVPIKRAITIAMVVGAWLSTGLVSAAVARAGPKPALLSAHGVTIRTHVGSYCVTYTPRPGDQYGVSECADAAAPTEPPRPRLSVRPRDRLRIRFRDDPRIEDDVAQVDPALVRVAHEDFRYVGGRIEVRQVSKRVWRFGLPEHLQNANALDVFVSYETGDASFLGGLSTKR